MYLCWTEWFKIDVLTLKLLNCFDIKMLNWIARNRTVLTSKLCSYTKLNYLKENCFDINSVYCPVGWDCRIHWLHLCRGVRHPPMSVLDMTVNILMVRIWRIRSTSSLPLLPGLLWPGVVAPDRVLSIC